MIPKNNSEKLIPLSNPEKNLIINPPIPNRINDIPPPPPQESLPPFPPPDRKPLLNVWIYDGQAYDLTEFIGKHPGGKFFIGRTKNRDITTIVNIFHPNPAKVKKVLQKYSLQRPGRPDDIHPKCSAPPFLFKPNFNGWIDTPKYDFNNQDQLLNKIKNRVNEPTFKQKIAQQDRLFNVISIILFILYFIVQWLYLDMKQYIPIYLFIPLIVMLRISLAGVGHYLIHRPQVGLNRVFSSIFDINYVPLALVVTDGHSLLHHPHTQSDVDIKRNVFTAVLELPRYYRVPIHTVHKITHIITGMFVRIIEIIILSVREGIKDFQVGVRDHNFWPLGIPWQHVIGGIAVHLLLLGELVLFTFKGDFLAWLGQFFITLWLSTFMIVASHDFEQEEVVSRNKIQQDWARGQIENSYDLTIVGNKYIDCFLSAGLSPHRTHHVLPQQKSGFANIISEEIVREEAEKMGIEWLEAKNFFRDRLPILIKHYLAVPSRMAQEKNMGLLQEHFHPQALQQTLDYVIKGWWGIGSI